MPGDKYEEYGKPKPPTDPNAEYMTLQETAFVLKCNPKTVTRLLDELGLKSKPGKRIVIDSATRRALYEHRIQGPKRIRRPARRARRAISPAPVKSAA
ncbi:DNA-binding protein [Streptomyces sp. ME19-01-6]|uniref:DNA-binding protein n=1 Tax=Streptomyces sp. ME19-01-6 TaxID=3028686 RepID=UPI0029B4ED42|nr:DNA-binding protein [Streptomyces sp. ME19-01-6]MDX3230534.1 DNA-binding protein [Streptomyces sp. ME19-01-6]